MTEGTAEIAGRLESLRYVVPGTYALVFLVVAADTTRLQRLDGDQFGTAWAILGVLAAFFLGYLLHLIGIRGTSQKKRESEQEEFKEAVNTWLRDPLARPGPPRGPHDVVNVLRSTSRLQWTGVRQLVIRKVNQLTRGKITQEQLDHNEKLRWFVYHFCFSYILKTGAAAEAQTNRSQFDMVRAFCVSLWVGFVASAVSLTALGIWALVDGLTSFWGQPLVLALIAVGLAAPFALGRLLREHQDRVSKRLAGSVYEAFLAT